MPAAKKWVLLLLCEHQHSVIVVLVPPCFRKNRGCLPEDLFLREAILCIRRQWEIKNPYRKHVGSANQWIETINILFSYITSKFLPNAHKANELFLQNISKVLCCNSCAESFIWLEVSAESVEKGQHTSKEHKMKPGSNEENAIRQMLLSSQHFDR